VQFTLRVRPPDGPERVVDLGGARQWRLGRRPDLEIVLPYAAVSSLHATIEKTFDGFAIVDSGSTNGTFVGGRRLAPKERRPFLVGDVLRIADVDLVIEELRAGQPRGESTGTLARRLVADLFSVMRRSEAPRLSATSGPAAGARLVLTELDRMLRIGRDDGCDLVLADPDVSREHARVVRRWDGVRLIDVGSKNGMEVSGLRVLGERTLRDGDEIVLGGTCLRFDDPEDRYLTDLAAAPVAMIMAPTVPVLPVEVDHPAEPVARRTPESAPVPEEIPRPPTPVATPVVPPRADPADAPPRPGGGVLALAALAVGVVVCVVGLAVWLLWG